jgi:acetolactate synthase I/II/III large subunit
MKSQTVTNSKRQIVNDSYFVLFDSLAEFNLDVSLCPSKNMLINGQSNHMVAISCFGDGDTGGGLFLCNGKTVQLVDRLSSTGLAQVDGQFYRLLRSVGEDEAVSEIIIYDSNGVLAYHRLDNVFDPHDIAWDGEHLVIASTYANKLVWISPKGQVIKEWQPPGELDSWHLNGLCIKDGVLYVSAFGRFRLHREWGAGNAIGTGIVFNFQTATDVISGLSCPHSPRFFDNHWVVCDSANKTILQISEAGQIKRKLQLAQWTRGIAVSDEYIFVGESAHRAEAARGMTASIAIISRQTWELLDRISLPCTEVYDLCMVPDTLAEGLKKGFRTNSTRVAEQDQIGLFNQIGLSPKRLWASGDILAIEDCKIRITAVPIDQIEADSIVFIDCVVESLAPMILASMPPYPVHLSYKWLEAETGLPLKIEGLRTRLQPALPPKQPTRYTMRIQAPATPGQVVLRITMVEESVAWFDNVDASNAFEFPVLITPKQGHKVEPA